MDEKRLQELKKHAELAATLQDESLNLIAAAHCVNGIPELLAETRAQSAEIERLHRLLESLTPGGSEFHDSPNACIEWVKSQTEALTHVAKQGIINDREKNAEIERLRAELESTNSEWLVYKHEFHKQRQEVERLLVWQAEVVEIVKEIEWSSRTPTGEKACPYCYEKDYHHKHEDWCKFAVLLEQAKGK